jgi:hypothetical protein
MMASAIRIQRIMLIIIVEKFMEIKRVDSTTVKSSLESIPQIRDGRGA